MVQKDGSWQWLLEGFKFDLEAQVRPKTVEYYYDHARIFVRWVETTGITEPRLLTRRDINSFFHYITNDSPTAKRNNGAGKKLIIPNHFDFTIIGASRDFAFG